MVGTRVNAPADFVLAWLSLPRISLQLWPCLFSFFAPASETLMLERERERDLVVSVEDEWIGGMVDLTPQMGFEETFVGV